MDVPHISRNGIQGKLYQPSLTHNQVQNNYTIWYIFWETDSWSTPLHFKLFPNACLVWGYSNMNKSWGPWPIKII
jgi:hypothetical protein